MALPTRALEEGRDFLSTGLLAHDKQGPGAARSGARSVVTGAIIGGFAIFGILAILPAGEVSVSRTGVLGDVQAQTLVADNVPEWYHRCPEQNEFCDMRRNLRDELDYEAHWAYDFLTAVSTDKAKMDLYLSFFENLHEHIKKTQATRGPECQNLKTWSETTQFWKKEGHDFGKNGRSMANFADANYVLYKKAEDSTHKGTPDCAWDVGAPGWGANMTLVELSLKGDRALISRLNYRRTDKAPGYELIPKGTVQDANKYMWSQKKGRGVDMDKVSMTMDIDRSVVTDSMGKVLAEGFMANKGETDEQRLLPPWRQRLLPGTVRWDATFMNDNFGIFSYGDGEGWVQQPDVRHFFYDRNVHGFGIFGRNLSEGSNPAKRMMDAGMPWIGGASGSLVDFYLAARDLGYKGEDLADLMAIDMAALVAGGHHSLGELLIAATEANRAGGEMTFQKDNKSFSFFDGPKFGQLLDIMDTMSEEEYRAKCDDLAPEGGLPGLYTAAMEEFMARTGPSDYKRSSSSVGSRIGEVLSKEKPTVKQCINLAGVPLFKSSLFKLGGPEHSFATWKLEDVQDFSKDGLSPAQFVTKLGRPLSSMVALYATRAFKEIAGDHNSTTEKELEEYFNAGSDGTPALVAFLRPFKHDIIKSLWPSSASWQKFIPRSSSASKQADEAAFSAAVLTSVNKALLDVHECITDAVGKATQDVLQSLYFMASLHYDA